MRKFAERRILASPSLSKMLFPTSMVAKDCRLLMVTLRAWTRLHTGPDHQAPALWLCDCRRVQDLFLRRKSCYRIFLACSVGGALRFHRKNFVVKFRKAQRSSFGDIFFNVRFEFPISLYTFGYIGGGRARMDALHHTKRRSATEMAQ